MARDKMVYAALSMCVSNIITMLLENNLTKMTDISDTSKVWPKFKMS
jgi:hypothetical protein